MPPQNQINGAKKEKTIPPTEITAFLEPLIGESTSSWAGQVMGEGKELPHNAWIDSITPALLKHGQTNGLTLHNIDNAITQIAPKEQQAACRKTLHNAFYAFTRQHSKVDQAYKGMYLE